MVGSIQRDVSGDVRVHVYETRGCGLNDIARIIVSWQFQLREHGKAS